MIIDWLNYEEIQRDGYTFKLINISEKHPPDDEIIDYLKEEILLSYKEADYYRFIFEESQKNEELEKSQKIEELKEYIKNYVIPSDESNLDRNVRQGDWGEILTALIVERFFDLIVPIRKMKWKYNKNKSVFSTDLLAHNKGSKIEDIYYYETKTRLNPQKKEGNEPNRHYISIIAHNSLLNDEQAPNESIASFLTQLYFEKKDYENAKKYKDVVLNPKKYNRKFELFFILEKSNFINEIIDELNALPPKLKPLCVTIFLVDNLNALIKKCWDKIEEIMPKILEEAVNGND